MDRRVKERLIGASILVVLTVLVVPELLSGPKAVPQQHAMLPVAAASDTNRTVLVDLSTSKPAATSESEEAQPASSAASPPIALPAVAVPATAVPTTASPASAPVVATVESAPQPPISSLRGAWSVQLGSFASHANADNLTRQLKGQGFSAFVLEGGSGKSLRYRVRVGPVSDRDSAERMAAKLKLQGHVSSLVGPAG